MLSTAQKYIARRYEEAVDLGLDVEAVRRYLLAHGIKHTPAQVVHQLDNVLCFAGYAASHPAPLVDVKAYDRTTARKDWINPIPSVRTYGPTSPKVVTCEPHRNQATFPVQKILDKTNEPVHNVHTIF